MEVVTKTYEVIDATAKSIEDKARNIGCSEGEVLDRVISRFSTTDANVAKLMLSDYLCLTTEKLSGVQTEEVCMHMILSCAYLLCKTGAYTEDTLFTYLQETLYKIREDEKNGVLKSLSDETMEAYRKWKNQI